MSRDIALAARGVKGVGAEHALDVNPSPPSAGMMVQAWDEDAQEASVQEITKVHVIHNRPTVKMPDH